jgi:hypothetical protein
MISTHNVNWTEATAAGDHIYRLVLAGANGDTTPGTWCILNVIEFD